MFYSVIIPLQQVHLNILINCWVHANTSYIFLIYFLDLYSRQSIGGILHMYTQRANGTKIFIYLDGFSDL
jgi:hypothetical protein